MKWKQYFKNEQKKKAKGQSVLALDYGEELFQTPFVVHKDALDRDSKVRWVVTQYKGEYQLFLERYFGDKIANIKWLSAFNWQDKAKDIALTTYLMCEKALDRKGLKPKFGAETG